MGHGTQAGTKPTNRYQGDARAFLLQIEEVENAGNFSLFAGDTGPPAVRSHMSCLPMASGRRVFFSRRRPRNVSAFWAALSQTLTICLRTVVPAHKPAPARKSLGEQICSPGNGVGCAANTGTVRASRIPGMRPYRDGAYPRCGFHRHLLSSRRTPQRARVHFRLAVNRSRTTSVYFTRRAASSTCPCTRMSWNFSIASGAMPGDDFQIPSRR